MSNIPRERSCSVSRSETSMLNVVREYFATHQDLWQNNQDKLDPGRPDVMYKLKERGVFDKYGWLEGKMIRMLRDRDQHRFKSGLEPQQSFKLRTYVEHHDMNAFLLMGVVDRFYLIQGNATCVKEHAVARTLDEYEKEAIFVSRINRDGAVALRAFLVGYHKNPGSYR